MYINKHHKCLASVTFTITYYLIVFNCIINRTSNMWQPKYTYMLQEQ